MGEDGLLLVPPWWIPDLDLVREFPAGKRLLEVLAAAIEVDYFRWPMLEQDPSTVGWRDCVEALAETMLAHHHVLDPGASTSVVLGALNKAPAMPRSFATVGLSSPSPATLYALGLDSQAQAVEAVLPVVSAPSVSNFLRVLMQGAEEKEISRLAAEVDSRTPPSFRFAFLQEVSQLNLLTAIKPNDLPALCLTSDIPFAMAQEMATVYETLLPRAEYDEVHLFPIKLHDEAAGEELAHKVIAFVNKLRDARTRKSP